MSKPGSELEAFSAAQTAIEPFRAGGIIESAIGVPERSMDGMIQGHLANIAMLNARGDTAPERPAYIFNPDTGLLINYAYRRHDDPARSGLFADIVELDDGGKPRHGVGAVNPFATETGFVQVAVGENAHGFAPTSVTMKLDSDDPSAVEPPNIEMADLVAMLQSEPIPADMPINVYLRRQQTTQEEIRARTERRQMTNYLPTMQALDTQTNPNLHLIITDREPEEVVSLETASREVGVYPILLTAREIVASAIEMKNIDGAYDPDRLSTFVSTRRDDVRGLLANEVPAFLTLDFEDIAGCSPEDRERKWIPFPRDNDPLNPPRFALTELLGRDLRGRGAGILHKSPFFSRIVNEELFPEDTPQVQKAAHGRYELAIDTNDPKNLENYNDWLRKAKLDYMLTLYLRGSNQL